mgnify:CR=1 FL=1
MSRNRVLVAGLVAVVLAGLIGWFAGTRIASPAEIAARAQPPEASLITVAVDRTVLSADIVARGTIGFDDPISLSLAGSTGNPDDRQVVTSVPSEGTDLDEGDVAVEVAGRPVFLLAGGLPPYRDLRPGAVGADVLQLEEALVRLGYLDSADDRWTSATGGAVEALYAAAGYVANSTASQEKESLEAARARVQQASRDLRALDSGTGTGTTGAATKSELLAARSDVSAAQEALSLAELQRDTDNAAAGRAVTAAAAVVANASADVTLAAARSAQARSGTHPDTGEPPTAVEVADLDSALALAQVSLTDAANASAAAEAAVPITAKQGDSAAAAARRAVDVARAALKERESPPAAAGDDEVRGDLVAEVTAANAALADLTAGIGTWLPSGEVVYVAALPVQVAKVETARGDVLSAAFITVSGAEKSMTVSLQAADLKRVAVGDVVRIDEADLPVPLEGTVSVIPDAGGKDRVDIEVALDQIPEELVGANVRVIIPIESTAGEVLVVPAAALSSLASGDVRVQVEDSPGQTRFVTVKTGLATDGSVEVAPLDGTLDEGDRVVVGMEGLDAAEPSSAQSSPG